MSIPHDASSPFLNLPAELRNTIYKYVVVQDGIIRIDQANVMIVAWIKDPLLLSILQEHRARKRAKAVRRAKQPGTCCVSRQVRSESLPICLAENRFYIENRTFKDHIATSWLRHSSCAMHLSRVRVVLPLNDVGDWLFWFPCAVDVSLNARRTDIEVVVDGLLTEESENLLRHLVKQILTERSTTQLSGQNVVALVRKMWHTFDNESNTRTLKMQRSVADGHRLRSRWWLIHPL